MSDKGNRTVRKLSAIETGKLYGWIDGKRADIGTGNATASEVASLAAQELGFTVPESSVRNLCAEMNVKLKGAGERGPRTPPFDPAPLLKEIADIRARMDAMAEWAGKVDNRLADNAPRPTKKAS